MNIKKNIITIFWGLVCFLAINTSVYSNTVTDSYGTVSEDVLIKRLYSINSPVDIKVTPEVKKIIRRYTLDHRHASEAILGKTSIFFPLFEKILKSENLPSELKYLSVIESGLKPTVQSRAGATGLWQFMKGTGKMYGLKINNNIDQRKDPQLSTEAAAKFLKDLYSQFDNWTLALAAYNCGPGNVRKAIRRSGSTDYWKLQKYLPKETRRYIPKFIATMYLHQYYESYNLIPKKPDIDYSNLLRVPVISKLKFKEVSEITGLTVTDIRSINPSYIRNYIPATGTNYINLPHESMYLYLHNAGELERDVYSFIGDYKTSFSVKPTLKASKIDNTIADIYILKYKSSLSLNSSTPYRNIEIKPIITIPNNTQKLRKGETLVDLARRLKIDIGDLVKWNHLDMNHLPKPGAIIKISLE